MIRKVALFATLSLLSACVTRSPRGVEVAVARLACDPGLTAPARLEPPVEGTILAPATHAERAAVGAFLSAEAEARAWGREGWARAALAAKACGGPLRDAAGDPPPD